MSVATVDTLCQRRRCIKLLLQFVIWFAQFFKGWLHIPYNILSIFLIPDMYISHHFSGHTDCIQVLHVCQCRTLCFQHCPARSYRSTWPPSRMNSACRRPWVSGIPQALRPTEAWRTSSDVVQPRSSMVAFRCWPPWDTSPQWLGFAEAAFKIVSVTYAFVNVSISAITLYIYIYIVAESTGSLFLNASRWNNPQEITGKFPGYLSPSAGLKFADVPNGLAAISKVPAAGQGWNNRLHLKIEATYFQIYHMCVYIYILCVYIYIYIHKYNIYIYHPLNLVYMFVDTP